MVDNAVAKLVAYAIQNDLIRPYEKDWAVNTILDALKLDSYTDPGEEFWWESNLYSQKIQLAPILEELLDDAYARGVLAENSVVYRDLFDTELMGRLTPRPSEVRDLFQRSYERDPKMATDWYYKFSQDTNYIRRDRIAKDIQWKAPTPYGELDVTINLSKPEKDPKAIAAAKNLPASAYPRCQLCAENEGYAGRVNHPARQNHRIVPITINGSPWFLQYSPYVYYNEHCICLNSRHVPMKIDRACFSKLLDFVGQFPHYFVGSNADLPIVGGSILAHDHFQGGRYEFAMAKAPVETPFTFPGFEDVEAGIVKWPMSVVRLAAKEPERLVELADKILTAWRGYTDEGAFIYAETEGEPHNTITPIARKRGDKFQLDLVLRNNITTAEHPLGVYHPHAELHHIKKENIGLIEVMGLAVLPARLKEELAAVADGLVKGADLRADERTEKHAGWAETFAKNYEITADNALDIVKAETGKVFAQVLEHCGVYARTPEGKERFLKFLSTI
ncbi:MAG: UDP-glucose--hexose-1-phosphate uridylyltransferase [Oscillospiraceae bacterium]|nr:UDP-glucose--hexose-1-phosphate uridylyltransferase [Oscillospiraceae bacterium]